MPWQTGLPAALAAFGLRVETVPGWETRGSSALTPRGAVSHWTAGPRGTTTRPSLNVCTHGRTGLPGPLCNVYLDRGGVAVVVAAGVANHAGVGGWRGLTSNSEVFGTEAESGGDGDWTSAQRAAYPRINAAYCRLGGFGPDMVCGHSEWAPTRKIDIRDWPMALMRSQVAALLASPTNTPEVPELDATERKLLNEVHAMLTGRYGPGGRNLGDMAVETLNVVGRVHGKVIDSRFGTTGRPGPDVDDLLGHVLSIRAAVNRAATGEQVAASLRPLLLEAVREGMAADNAAQADDIVDRLAARLTG